MRQGWQTPRTLAGANSLVSRASQMRSGLVRQRSYGQLQRQSLRESHQIKKLECRKQQRKRPENAEQREAAVLHRHGRKKGWKLSRRFVDVQQHRPRRFLDQGNEPMSLFLYRALKFHGEIKKKRKTEEKKRFIPKRIKILAVNPMKKNPHGKMQQKKRHFRGFLKNCKFGRKKFEFKTRERRKKRFIPKRKEFSL